MIFYLSFAEETFLGGVFTEASSKEEAILRVTDLGNNPGGEALIVEPGPNVEFPPNIREYLDVLFSKVALEELFGPVVEVTIEEVP